MNRADLIVERLLESEDGDPLSLVLDKTPELVYVVTSFTATTYYVPDTDYSAVEREEKDDHGEVFVSETTGPEGLEEVIEFLKSEGVTDGMATYRNVSGDLIEGYFSKRGEEDGGDVEQHVFYYVAGATQEEMQQIYFVLKKDYVIERDLGTLSVASVPVRALLEDDFDIGRSDLMSASDGLPRITSTFALFSAGSELTSGSNGEVWTYAGSGDSDTPVVGQMKRFLISNGVNWSGTVDGDESTRVYGNMESVEAEAAAFLARNDGIQPEDDPVDDGELVTYYRVHGLSPEEEQALFNAMRSEGRV